MNPEGKNPEIIRRMFDRIAGRYDLGNLILSVGMDSVWRRRVRDFLPDRYDLHVLDVATGTGDLLFAVMRDARVISGTGIDFSEEMIVRARRKARASGSWATFLQADAARLDRFENDADVATIAFGIRNTPDPVHVLSEILKVLKPGGRAVVLEFSMPSSRLFRPLYLLYLRRILPWIGSRLSGDAEAYRYLDSSIEAFPSGEDFRALMWEAGFVDLRVHPLSFGIVTIYTIEELWDSGIP
ncbi:MAG: bifunctional demethylmenaquinone methyltransferase/2-methoxy-6-polyprenyl-1,4-benzoquinol methylase UbiE [Planctomycetota bacterium]|jgi:demethylmenaquinone methyltransferase/2-methoxy-6-polyprenyl-1,4-benzoquinol methylase